MKLSTSDQIPGSNISSSIGIARGSTVRTRNVGYDIFAQLKTIIGGEVESYTKLQADAREQALQRMVSDAEQMGADAVVCIRFQSSVMMAGASEILAYIRHCRKTKVDYLLLILIKPGKNSIYLCY